MIIVSVIIATYRRDRDLVRALKSVAEQSYNDIEIVLVDDNGDKEWNKVVENIVESFRNDYPRTTIKYYANALNQGSAKSRNIGIEKSTGKYISFLDDDDVYLPQKIKRQLEFMESELLDYSITNLELFNESEQLIDKRTRKFIKETTPEALLQYHMKYHLTGTDTMMFLKSYLEKIGGFAHIDVGDEFYLMQRAIEGNGKFGHLPFCDVKAYIHTGENGLSSGESKINGENELYKYKQTYFNKINFSTRQHIKMRHFAVLGFAELKRKRIFSFGMYAIRSFLSSPFCFFEMLLGKR